MRIPPQTLFRGLGKFVAVALAAALAGAGIGIALAELSGSGDSSTPAASATTTTAAPVFPISTPTRTTVTTAAQPAQTAPSTSAPAAPATRTPFKVPRVQVLSAQIGPTSSTTGRARVNARIRVTNRSGRPLELAAAVLIAGDDEVPLDSGARDGARPLLGTLDPGETATGLLRFTVTPALAQRLSTDPAAQLRIAKRTIALTLTTSTAAG